MSVVQPVYSTAIPVAPMDVRRWCVWRYWNGQKVPRRVDDTGNAVLKDLSTLTSFENAYYAFENPPFGAFDGIAFYLSRHDMTYCLDLDSCVAHDQISLWAISILQAVPSYSELSPSGTGFKIFAIGKVPSWINCRKSYRIPEFIPANAQKKSECLVIREGLVAITGRQLSGVPNSLIDDRGALLKLCDNWEQKLRFNQPTPVVTKSQTLLPPASIVEATRRLKACNMPPQADDGSRLLFSLVIFMIEHWNARDQEIHQVINNYHKDTPLRMLDGLIDTHPVIQIRIEQARCRLRAKLSGQ